MPEFPAQRVFWLGGVDQEAAFEIGVLAERLAKLIAEIRPEIVITHAYEGGHPDHDSAAVVAKIAILVARNSALVAGDDFVSRAGRPMRHR